MPPTPETENQRDAEEQDDSITVQTAATTNNIKRKIDDVHGGGTEMDDDVDSSSPTPNQHSYGSSLSTWHFVDIDVAKKQFENAGAMLELAKAHMQLAQKHYAEAEQFLGDTYKRKKKELYAAGRKKRARKAALSGATKIVG